MKKTMNNAGQITLSRKEMGKVEGGGNPWLLFTAGVLVANATHDVIKGYTGEKEGDMWSNFGKNLNGLANAFDGWANGYHARVMKKHENGGYDKVISASCTK